MNSELIVLSQVSADWMQIVTIVFEIVVSVVLFCLLPWASKVTSQLAAIETTLIERAKQETRLDDLTKRLNRLEVSVAGIRVDE